MSLIGQLLTIAAAYRDARGLSTSRVSFLVFGDGKVIAGLSGGRDITTRRMEAALQWFSDNWPEGAEWPCAVKRPPAAAHTETPASSTVLSEGAQ